MNLLAVPRTAEVVLRFNVRNQRAERWLRDYSTDLVTHIVQEQRETIQNALGAALERGDGPRRTALQIAGRVDRTTGRREGGVIGLSKPQAEYVDSARKELRSGDATLVRNYLSRERRDARFDRTVLRYLREGKGVPAELADKIAGRYSASLLQLRGEMIARTETMAALGASQHEALMQAVDAGAVPAQAAKTKWKSAKDRRVRHTHAVMDGQVRLVGEAFVSPSGAQLRFPGDPRAPASERIACRCWTEPVIDFLAGVR